MSAHRPRLRFAPLLLAAAVTTVGVAHAEDRATAQELFEQARELMAQKKFAEACPKLEGAAKLVSSPGVRLNLADCYERSARFASAWAAFDDAAAAADRAGDSAAGSEAAIGKRRVAPKRSFLVVTVAGAEETTGLEVHRDGTFVPKAAWGSPLPVDAGEHVIDATAPGHKAWSAKVTVGQTGAPATVSIPVLERDVPPAGAPTPAPSAVTTGATSAVEGPVKPATPDTGAGSRVDPTQRTLAYVAGGIGVIGVGVGVFFAVRSHDKRTQADELCPGGVCRASTAGDLALLRDEVDGLDADATSAGRTALLSSMVGGVALASGVVLFIMSSRPGASASASASAPARVTPFIGLGSAGVTGRF